MFLHLCILTLSSHNVQPLVCKPVTRLHEHHLTGRALLMKMLITLEPRGMFSSNFVYLFILTLSASMQNGDEASFWLVELF